MSCGVLGANLLQAVVLRRLTGRYVRCFDHTFLSRAQNAYSLFHAGVGADIIVLLGQNGLYDSCLVGGQSGSDAEFAALTGTPVVLTVDGSKMGSSLAAVVKGFESLTQQFTLAGSIATKVFERHVCGVDKSEVFAQAFAKAGLDAPLGLVGPTSYDTEIPPVILDESRNRTILPRQFFIEIAELVREHVDLERFMALASGAPRVELPDLNYEPSSRRARIAVAEDSCFHVCFQDNLDLLKYYGAEIVSFSPLADEELPSGIGAVYLPSGVIREYGYELARNEPLRSSLRSFAGRGGCIYSEGSGSAYLCSSFEVAEGEFVDGVGVLSGAAYANGGELTNNEGVTVEDSILGEPGIILKSLSSHSWRFVEEDSLSHILRLTCGDAAPVREGYSPTAQSFCTFSLAHFGSNPVVAAYLVDAATVIGG